MHAMVSQKREKDNGECRMTNDECPMVAGEGRPVGARL